MRSATTGTRLDGRCVRVHYRSEAERDFTSEVEPWAVVVRHGRWYLLCRSLCSGTVRTYRVDRVRGVEVLETPLRLPRDLDPVASLEEHLAAGWEHPVEVLLDAPLERVRWVPRTMGRLEEAADGRTRLVGTTSNLDEYARDLARLPVAFTVVDGPALRAAVATLGRRLADASG